MDPFDLAANVEKKGLWDWNLLTNRVHFSPLWISMVGCQEHELGNTPEEWLRRIHPEDREQVQRDIKAQLEGTMTQFEARHRMLHKDGSYRWMSSRGLIVRDEGGQAVRMRGFHVDITAEVLADTLTGLPNQLALLDRLTRSIEQAGRNKDFIFALLLLDIDRFKSITSSVGSAQADQLLIGVARRMETCLHAADFTARLGRNYVVARHKEDKFIILLDGLSGAQDAESVAQDLLKQISQPFELNGHQVFLTASIGIALSMTGYGRPEDALRDADTALHRAKLLGKGCFEVFDTANLHSVRNLIQLEGELQNVIRKQELALFYQPIISLASGRILGFEALVRWPHSRGMISPSEFIPVAENSGLILPLGQWVLQEACRQLKKWQQEAQVSEGVWISVNLSIRQLGQPQIVEEIAAVLNASQLPPHCLMVELTESVMVDNIEAVRSRLMQLRVLGVQIAVDDFGTGYSSFSYLSRFPVDFLKIDHSFTRRMETGGDALEIMRTISALAQQLGLKVVVEGIENSGQLETARLMNFECGQGFLFSQAVDAERAGSLLKEGFISIPEDQKETAPPELDSDPDSPGVVDAAERPRKNRVRAGTASLLIASAMLMLLLGAAVVLKGGRMKMPSSSPPAETRIGINPAAENSAVIDPAPQPAVPELTKVRPTPKPGKTAVPVANRPVTKPELKPELAGKPAKATAAAPPAAVYGIFAVIHKHNFGSCKGTLKVSAKGIAFVAENGSDDFNLKYGDFTYEGSSDRLTIKSSSKTYRFKSANGEEVSFSRVVEEIRKHYTAQHS